MGLGFAAFGAELPELEARCHERLYYARPTALAGPRTRRGRRLIIYYHGPDNNIAIALHIPPHRAVGLALLAQALGATKEAAKDAARQEMARRLSSSVSMNRFSSFSLRAASPRPAGGNAASASRDVELAIRDLEVEGAPSGARLNMSRV